MNEPWRIEYRSYENEDGTQSSHWIEIWDEKGCIAFLDENQDANAKIIATAPRMLAALKTIVSIKREDGRYDKHDMAGAIVIARKAIKGLEDDEISTNKVEVSGKTQVIFRLWRKSVIALFPYEIADRKGDCLSYMRTGQHSAANYEAIITQSRPAIPAEYISLEIELESLGYRLELIKRRNRSRYLSALARMRAIDY